MENFQRFRILIADDDIETCSILRSFFDMQIDMTVCGVVHDGIQALKSIYNEQPDIAIIDVVMPGKDGICVLEEMREKPPLKRPLVIMTSANGQELITRKAAALGADYFVMKPYSLDTLLSRVRMVAGCDKDLANSEQTRLIRRAVAKKAVELGAPTQNLGYKYIENALITLTTQTKPCSIGKMIYAAIALEHETNVDCVERAIRQAIHRIHLNRTEMYCEIMKFGNQPLDKPPSNSRFLTLVAIYIRLEENLD